MFKTDNIFKELVKGMTRKPITTVLVGGMDVDYINIDYKSPQETFVGGLAGSYIVLHIGAEMYEGSFENILIQLFVSFLGSPIQVPIGMFYPDKDDIEFDEVSKTYTITAYDNSIKTDKRYKKPTFPIRTEDLLDELCSDVGIELDPKSWDVLDKDAIIKGIEVNDDDIISYRQVGSQLAQFNLAMAVINRDGKLEFRRVFDSTPVEQIDGVDYFDLEINKEIKPINALVVEQADIDDPVYKRNETSIARYGLTELKISGNIFLDYLDKEEQQTYVDSLFTMINGFTYHPFYSEQVMRPDFDTGDVVELVGTDGDTYKSVITSIDWTWSGGGLRGSTGCPLLPETITDYTLAGDRQNLLNMGIKVDRLNEEITAGIKRTDDLTDRQAQLQLLIDKIGMQVGRYEFGSVLKNGTGELGTFEYWHFNEDDTPLVLHDSLLMREYLTMFTNFDIIEDPNQTSGYKISFFAEGGPTNGPFEVTNEYTYSFRTKRVSGEQAFELIVTELSDDYEIVGEQQFNIAEGDEDFSEIEGIALNENTKFIALTYQVTEVDLENRLEISDTMFNAGAPKDYTTEVEDVYSWTQAKLEIFDDEIQRVIEDVDGEKERITKIVEGIDGIMREISESFVKFETFEDEDGNIVEGFNKYKETVSYLFEETTEGFNAEISKTKEDLDKTDKKIEETRTFFRFEEDGVKIGGTEWITTLRLDGENVTFITDIGGVKAQFGVDGLFTNKWQTDYHTIEKFDHNGIQGTIWKDRKVGA